MPSKSASEVASAHLSTTREKSRRLAGLASPNAKGITDEGYVGRLPSQGKDNSTKASVEAIPPDKTDEASNDNAIDEATPTDHVVTGKDALPQKDALTQGKRKNGAKPKDAQNETPLVDESSDDGESTPLKS